MFILVQGTPTSKKKKLRKLKRVMGTLEKTKRRGAANQADSFAALQLLHDAQTFSERLFVRLQARGVSFETRLVMMQVCSTFSVLLSPLYCCTASCFLMHVANYL